MSETKPEASGKLYCDILTSKPESLSIDELFKGIVHFLIGRAKREDEYHNEERFYAFKDQLFNRVNVLRNTNADMLAALEACGKLTEIAEVMCKWADSLPRSYRGSDEQRSFVRTRLAEIESVRTAAIAKAKGGAK